jgi:hypothetical protein
MYFRPATAANAKLGVGSIMHYELKLHMWVLNFLRLTSIIDLTFPAERMFWRVEGAVIARGSNLPEARNAWTPEGIH